MKRKLIFLVAEATILCAALRTGAGAAPTTNPKPLILQDRLRHEVLVAEGETRLVGQSGLAELTRVFILKGYRATFCENATPQARCRRLVAPNVDGFTAFTAPFSRIGTTVKVEKALFGFADLHVHPATHLAWGARGGQGILWGRPGMAYEDANVAHDLAACPTFRDSFGQTFNIHTWVSGPFSPIVAAARFGFFLARAGDHGSSGYPGFLDWPSANSTIHQQVHVTMLRRAWEGGLRLMVASATDSQLLDIVWNPEFSLSHRRFAFREDFDYNSAKDQFEFIEQFVAANASWMTIVKTPAEARDAIDHNKLAVVLGLEMDQLSAEEILKLKEQYGVALVTPVHLVNNSFGGAALYEDFFNLANLAMNGSFFSIVPDPAIGFQLGRSKEIPIITSLLGYQPTPPTYFATGDKGHRNPVGVLDDYGMKRLMKAGLLIDTAHMSSNAMNTTVVLAQASGYPLLHSHGGKRWGDKPSERGMSDAQFQALEDSGGILGMGTGAVSKGVTPILEWLQNYLEVAKVGPVALGSDLNGMAEQISRSERGLEYPTNAIANADWTGHTQVLPMFQLAPGTKLFDIHRDGIAHIGMLPDFLAVVRQWAEDLGKTSEVDQIFHSAHDFIATWERATLAAPTVNADLPSLPISRINIRIKTGTDGLKCGGVMVSAIHRVEGQSKVASLPAMIRQALGTDSPYAMALEMLPGTQVRDIDGIRFDYLPVKCDPFDTGDSWNIKTLEVTYDLVEDGYSEQGVLIHKRGAPVKRLNRGETWTVATER